MLDTAKPAASEPDRYHQLVGSNRLTTLPASILAADAVDGGRTTVSLAAPP